MKEKSKPEIWMAQMRANFLLLVVLLVAIGWALVFKFLPEHASFSWGHAILVLLGALSAHISVNLFNEYSDFQTKIDFHTERTPFSGGSGMLAKGYLQPGQVIAAAIATLVFSAAIGVYFTLVAHWSILIISLIGAIAIVFYTNFLARYMLGEFIAGLALGTLVVIGTFIALFASPGMTLAAALPLEVFLISIPPGILTSLLLLINEFPDVEADKKGGRYHLVIRFGRGKSAYIYTAGMILTFVILALIPILGITSNWLLLALLPFPLGIRAAIGAIRHGDDTSRLVPYLGMNVMVVLGTDFLIALSLFISVFA